MCNQECLTTLLKDNNFDLGHIVNYYISYLSIFYCKDINLEEDELNNMVNNLDDYIKKNLYERGEEDVQQL